MFKNIQIPPSFSLVEKGKVSLLLKEEYKTFLLKQGIDDLKTFIKKTSQTSHYSQRSNSPSLHSSWGWEEDGSSPIFTWRTVTSHHRKSLLLRGKIFPRTDVNGGDPILWNSYNLLHRCHPPSHSLSLLSGLFSFLRSPSRHGSDSVFSRNRGDTLPVKIFP